MRYTRRLLLIPCLLILLVLPALGATSPLAQVQTTVDKVIEVLRDGKLQGAPRREVLSKLIRVRFDFVVMSQRTLGKYWKTATPAEQERFVVLFSDLLEASYIGRIEAYRDETVKYLEEKFEEGRAEVKTQVRSGGVDIPIDYRLLQVGADWFVYDVVVEDVSLIKNYRSSYGEIVRKEGFSGLFGRMEEKLVELRRPAETSGS